MSGREELWEWVSGRPKPTPTHSNYLRAKKTALSRIRPRIRSHEGGNLLWNRILHEHNVDMDFWLYDDTIHPEETEVWKYLAKHIIPDVMVALERTCRLKQTLKESGLENRMFSFSDSFVHFLMSQKSIWNSGGRKFSKDLGPENVPKYMLMSRNKAAKLIQKQVRGWLVRKQPEVLEMRNFWKAMREGKQAEVVRTNSRVTFQKRSAEEPRDDFLVDLETIQRLEAVDGWSYREKRAAAEAGRAVLAEPALPHPCSRKLGVDDQFVQTLGEEDLRELLRVCSVQNILRPDAVRAFLSQRSQRTGS